MARKRQLWLIIIKGTEFQEFLKSSILGTINGPLSIHPDFTCFQSLAEGLASLPKRKGCNIYKQSSVRRREKRDRKDRQMEEHRPEFY